MHPLLPQNSDDDLVDRIQFKITGETSKPTLLFLSSIVSAREKRWVNTLDLSKRYEMQQRMVLDPRRYRKEWVLQWSFHGIRELALELLLSLLLDKKSHNERRQIFLFSYQRQKQQWREAAENDSFGIIFSQETRSWNEGIVLHPASLFPMIPAQIKILLHCQGRLGIGSVLPKLNNGIEYCHVKES